MTRKIIIVVVAVVVIVSGVTFGVAYFVAKNIQSNKNTTSSVIPTTNTVPETTKPNGANPSLPVTESPNPTTTKACTQEAKLCSDGSYVGRTGPNCEFSDCPQTPVVQAKTYTINIANFAFSPTSLNINKGDTVVWANNDSAPHQIAGSGFGSSALSNGGSYSFKFKTVGMYDYHCAIHPSMQGTVIVK